MDPGFKGTKWKWLCIFFLKNSWNLHIPESVFLKSVHLCQQHATAPNTVETCLWLPYDHAAHFLILLNGSKISSLVGNNQHVRPREGLSNSVISFWIKNMECWMPRKTSQSNTKAVKRIFTNALSNNIIEVVVSPLFIHYSLCSKLNSVLSAHVMITNSNGHSPPH